MGKPQQGPVRNRNKLSKMYRFKKKTGRVQKRYNDDETSQIKKAKIIVRNLPFKMTELDFRQFYEPYGEIEEIKVLKRPDGKLVGCGFVQFKKMEDASKAIFKTNKSEFLGRIISSEWAIPKSQFVENLKKEREFEGMKEGSIDEEANIVEQNQDDNQNSFRKRENSFLKKNALSKAEQRKLYKLKKRQKRSRIVIRNLVYSVTEEQIKEHFAKYGTIEDIRLVKKADGTLTGCCFLQFDRVQSAAQSIHHENMKPLLDRPMVVDWALPKDKFEKMNSAVKTEQPDDDDISVVKDEFSKESNESKINIKIEKESDDEEIKQEDDNNSNESRSDDIIDDDEEDDNDDEENEDDEDIDDKRNIKKEFDEVSTVSSITRAKRISNDVSEGKTVFIKNVPFNATNEELKYCMEQFGPVYYALICIDQLTEHSRGTAFVKFRNVEDAEKCLAAGTELKLNDQILDPHKALHRKTVMEKKEESKKKTKDSRNLYLVKEGVILASSTAAQDVSAADMAKRLQLEKWKSQMLRNLGMFVSRVRLVIQNLPPSMDDSKLRQLFKKHSNPNALITEARVMRDLKNVDANGIGKSKEYGFVSFTIHEDALKALRSINNNPNIFTKAKRPIVAFSIENRIMINAKQKRMEKSRRHNPLFQDRKRPAENASSSKDEPSNDKKHKKRKIATKKTKSENAATDEVKEFTGTTGKPGQTKPHGKFFLKKQAALHEENLKEQKKKAKSKKQLTILRKEQASSRREAKPKQGSKKMDTDEMHFNRLVNNYKDKLTSASNLKSKWYET